MGLMRVGDTAFCWGSATNIKNQVTKTGKPVTSFSIQYGRDGDNKLYLNCNAWGNLSGKYLNRLERGDIIMVAGRMEKDDFWSEKKGVDEYKLIVEWAKDQDLFDGDDVDEELDLTDF